MNRINEELKFEWRILGGSACDAVSSIKHLSDLEQLNTLLIHECNHMNRKSVVRSIKGRLRKIHKSMEQNP